MAKVGHHHILQAGEAQGLLWLPAQGLAGAQGEIAIPLAKLQIDEPAWRAEAGGEFNEKPLSDEERAATKRNLLVSLKRRTPSRRCACSCAAWSAPHPGGWRRLAVQLGRPRRRCSGCPWCCASDGEHLSVTSGRLVLRHSEHGLQAYSLLGGLLAVADEILDRGRAGLALKRSFPLPPLC